MAPRGGKRPGAGRPKSNPTLTVRVPERAADAAAPLAAHFLAIAEQAFRDEYASVIERNGWDPVVRLTGIETVEARSLMGGDPRLVPVLVGNGEMGVIRSHFRCGMDGSGFECTAEEDIEGED